MISYSRILYAVFPLLVLAAPSLGKRVICIDHTAGAENAFLSEAEGWARSQASVPPDKIQLGGDLKTCLANLANGDELIIIAHGRDMGAAFRWGGTDLTGFGGGAGQQPVPAGFGNLRNIKVRFIACWSSLDPDGPANPKTETGMDTSMVDKIIEAMGGATKGHMQVGAEFTKEAIAGFGGSYATPPGLTAEEKTALDRAVTSCLQANTEWEKNPPVNRSSPPPVPNHQTAAQAVIDACVAAGVPAGIRAVTFEISYPEPYNDTNQRGTGMPARVVDLCGMTQGEVHGIDQDGIPSLSNWGLAILTLLLLSAARLRFRRARIVHSR